jgi:hypothetical protein
MVAMHRSIWVGVALLLLGGCDWLGIGGSSTNSEKVRPGVERQVTVTNALPAARASGYDGSVTPVDETRSAPRIGSVVAGKGGQKAQKEAVDKEAAERDAKAREERLRHQREAALKKAQEGDKAGDKKPAATPTDAAPPVPAASATPPPAGSAPVTAAPLAPAPAAPPAPPSDTKQ